MSTSFRNSNKIITLATDFGTVDGYVGAMKGVILGLAAGVTLVDISHSIPAQDVHHGAHVLAAAVPYFPQGTIHVGVVDPGVGSARRGIAVQTPVAIFVGPDNGLFTPFLEMCTACVALTNPDTHREPVSATFHGRDIFAPVAAHLANGVPLKDLGPEVTDPVAWPVSEPQRLDGQVRAEITYIDRFGNLVTNLRPFQAQQVPKSLSDLRVVIKGQTIPFHHTYADVPAGELVALVGSSGYLEIAVRNGSAADRLGIAVGARVEIWGL
jgi:hypothetical protein